MIENIEIVEPYDVYFKKNKIIDKAFSSAFDLLISKIVMSNDLVKFEKKNLSEIKSMVDSFSIINESFINNNYSAKINVLFDKKKVLNYLHKRNVIPSILVNKKIVFFPIFINLNKNELSIYSENKFYIYWKKFLNESHLLKYTLLSEDLD